MGVQADSTGIGDFSGVSLLISISHIVGCVLFVA